jgi:hypothetical protein
MEKPQRQASAAEESADEDANSNSGSAEITPPRRKKNRKGKKSFLSLEKTADNALSGVTNTLGQVGSQALNHQQQQGQQQEQPQGVGGKSDTLRLRLDLNLDIEIQLKAKIHGDLELALLYVFNRPTSPLLLPPSLPLLYLPILILLEPFSQHWMKPYFNIPQQSTNRGATLFIVEHLSKSKLANCFCTLPLPAFRN